MADQNKQYIVDALTGGEFTPPEKSEASFYGVMNEAPTYSPRRIGPRDEALMRLFQEAQRRRQALRMLDFKALNNMSLKQQKKFINPRSGQLKLFERLLDPYLKENEAQLNQRRMTDDTVFDMYLQGELNRLRQENQLSSTDEIEVI